MPVAFARPVRFVGTPALRTLSTASGNQPNRRLHRGTQNSAITASATTPSAALAREVEQCYNKLDLTFENGREAFKSKANWEIVRGILVLRMCNIDLLVKYNTQILHSLRKVLGDTLFKKLLKATFFGHFVAGESRKEVLPIAAKLQRFGVKSILDYSAESDISQEEAEEIAVEGIVGEEVVPDVIATQNIVDPKTIDETHQRYTVHKEFGDRRVDNISARTYFYTGERECDKHADIFCNSIDAVAEATNGQGFTAIKLTALGRPQLLLKLSEMIAQTQNFFKAMTGSAWENLVLSRISEEDFLRRLLEFGIKTDNNNVKEWFKMIDFDDDGFVDYHDWGRLLDLSSDMTSMFKVLNIRTGQLEPLIVNLTKAEERECNNMIQRIVRVADHAGDRGIRIMIDAEQTYFQPAISRLTVAMMRKYNKNGGKILNTYQAYLKNSLTNLKIDMHLAKREDFHFGAKLVRGAYMDQERKRAEAVGYPDPINDNYNATTQMYHRCLDAIVEERAQRGPGNVSVMVATHNEESIRYAVQLMKDHNIAPSERTLCFAQLYGMCDQVSFPLGQAGYSVYKYLPYGPMHEVLPYLSRRAQENSTVIKKAGKERSMLWQELKRRIASGQLMYSVPTSI
ncbi:Proline dehydrogenase [Aphelenchoides besseyi]|nr:Proline dehydrogenase [Aphelenchoides besseyi]